MKEAEEDFTDMEDLDDLIEEIDILFNNSTLSLLREDQIYEYLLLKEAVSEGIPENEFLDSIGDILEYQKAKGGYDVRKMQVQRKLALRAKKKQTKSKSRGLSPSQRRKMALRMRIQAKKPAFIMKRKRMMKRAANKQTLQRRARKAAIKRVVKKFYPKLRGKKTSDLSYAERGKISDIVKKKAAIITRFAKRMIKDVRKKDVERRKSMNKNKNKK
tara:strand:- start:47 stop:694 length:648 start_codon:yes stop_codon:yes gene_type:complete